MEADHKLLKRQISRYLERSNYSDEGLRKFIQAVDQAYLQYDEDREMISRSLEISSQELLQSNSEMRAVFKAFPDLFFLLDSDGRIMDYIAGQENDLAVPAAQFLGKQMQDIPLGDVGEKFRIAIENVRKNHSVESLDYSLNIKDSTVYYEARIVPLLEKQMITLIRNITIRKEQEKELEKYRLHLEKLVEERTADLRKENTERKKAELNLRFQKTLLEAQHDTSDEGILLVSPKGRIISYNRRFLDLWNIPDTIAQTRSDNTALDYVIGSLANPQTFLERVQYLYEHPEEKSTDEIPLSDGRIFERYSSPVKSNDGVFYGRVWFFRDITLQKKAEKQLIKYHEELENEVEERTARLKATNEQLQQEIAERKRVEEELLKINSQFKEKTDELESANEEIKRFAYIVSHDLRAPLVNIKGFSSELQYSLETILTISQSILPLMNSEQKEEFLLAITEDIPEALEFIHSSTQRMDNLINSILKLSRLGRRELRFENVDVRELLDEILASIQHQIAETETEIILADIPQVFADRTSMEQILGNLVVNATKYLRKGVPGRIEIGGITEKETTTLYVKDNGRGIAQHEISRIFELFGRAGKQDIPGEGMGLTYARTLIRRHGGKIWCESTPDEGSIFSFTIINKENKGGSYAEK